MAKKTKQSSSDERTHSKAHLSPPQGATDQTHWNWKQILTRFKQPNSPSKMSLQLNRAASKGQAHKGQAQTHDRSSLRRYSDELAADKRYLIENGRQARRLSRAPAGLLDSSSARLKNMFKTRQSKSKRSKSDGSWMLYGAYGYTGKLIIERALAMGQRPILSGRSIIKLRPLAEKYDLPWRIVDLTQPRALGEQLRDIDLVCNVSGPFVNTSRTLIEACLESRTHYTDISGELPSVQMALAYEEQAKEAGIAIIPSCGISAIPTDCMIKHIVDRVGPLNSLEIALDVFNAKSPGTLASVLEVAAYGGRARRDHRLIHEPVGKRIKNFKFSHSSKTVVSVPLVDLTTSYWWSRTPNITTYLAQPLPVATMVKLLEPLNRWVLGANKFRDRVEAELVKHIRGPRASEREKARTYVWITATDQSGKKFEAGLETLESYNFTAASIPQIAKLILEGGCDQALIGKRGENIGGVYTPAQAFGADFVTHIPSTVRFGMLEPPISVDSTESRALALSSSEPSSVASKLSAKLSPNASSKNRIMTDV